MATVALTVNGELRSVDVDAQTPLLWVLRDTLGLTGTKYACGTGICGCCTVLVNGSPARSCIVTVGAVAGASITTIEGLSDDLGPPLQQAWLEEGVTQCGYCQPGQIMTAAGLLQANPSPTEAEIDAAMSSVLCRCGTYLRVRRAVARAAAGV